MARKEIGSQSILHATATQAAANTMIQVALNTGISAYAGVGNVGFKLMSATVEFADTTYTAGALVTRAVALTRATKAAIPNISDDDVLWKAKQGFLLLTGVGATSWSESVVKTDFDDEIIIIEDQIFLQFNTSSTAAAATAYVNLVLQPVTVTTDERITILQSRLN